MAQMGPEELRQPLGADPAVTTPARGSHVSGSRGRVCESGYGRQPTVVHLVASDGGELQRTRASSEPGDVMVREDQQRIADVIEQ